MRATIAKSTTEQPRDEDAPDMQQRCGQLIWGENREDTQSSCDGKNDDEGGKISGEWEGENLLLTE